MSDMFEFQHRYDQQRENELRQMIDDIPFKLTSGEKEKITTSNKRQIEEEEEEELERREREDLPALFPGSDINSLQQLNSQLKRSYDSSARRCREFEKEVTQLREEINELKKQKYDLTKQFNNVREELYFVKNDKNGISIEKLRGEVLNVRTREYEQTLAAYANLERECNALKTEVKEAKQALEIREKSESKEIARLNDELANSNVMLNTRDVECKKLRQELQSCKQKSTQLEKAVQDKTDLIQSLEKKVIEFDTQKQRMNQNSMNQSQQVLQLTEQKRELERLLAQKGDVIHSMQTQIKDLEESIHGTNYRSEYEKYSKQQAEKHLQEIRSMRDEHSKEISKLKEQFDEKIRAIRQSYAEKASNVKEQIELEKKTVAMQKDTEMEELKGNMERKHETNLRFITEKYKQTTQSLNETVDELREELDHEREKGKKLEHYMAENEKLRQLFDKLKKKYLLRTEKFIALKNKNLYLINGCDKLKLKNKYLDELNKELVQQMSIKNGLERSLNAQLEMVQNSGRPYSPTKLSTRNESHRSNTSTISTISNVPSFSEHSWNYSILHSHS